MEKTDIKPFKKIGPLFESRYFEDTKDPCITYDGKLWHIYGSGGSTKLEVWNILHATAEDILGPWTEQEPATLLGLQGPHTDAPSVVYDTSDHLFHMAIQKDFMAIGGGIEYFVSADGNTFTWMHTLLDPILNSSEAGLYDPHFSEINGRKYMAYAGMPAIMTHERPFTPQPDVYVAESITGLWGGPWERCKKILDHTDIEWHHNPREHPDYEWGIEGPQLAQLPNGKILLNATSFIKEGKRGTRQRVFFALADEVEGPFLSLGPVLHPSENEWESGENGHASVWVTHDILYLFYQGRAHPDAHPENHHWRYGVALFHTSDLDQVS